MKSVLKICLLCDGAVGKTTFRSKIFGKNEILNYIFNVATDYMVKAKSKIVQGKEYSFSIEYWDFNGSSISLAEDMLNKYISHFHSFILMYDLSRPSTIDSIDQWVSRIHNALSHSEKPDLKFFALLIGNKIDLKDKHKAVVTYELGNEFAIRLKSNAMFKDITFFETSAKTGDYVNEAVSYLEDNIISEIV